MGGEVLGGWGQYRYMAKACEIHAPYRIGLVFAIILRG